ncbi:MAG: BON domain-containing protein [Gammaproteobacteria bacterium]|nr:BON domain-containing protein [Gammaproteobacteria bacterium]
MKKAFFCLAMVFFLQGCVPAALVAGAAAGGAVVADKRSTQTIFEDRNITFQIQGKLDADDELKQKAHVSVATFDHIALLVGQAPTQELKNRAETLAKSVPKVKLLYNEITIEAPITELVMTNDAWITTKVKTVLMSDVDLKSMQLKIVTENSTVYLMGLTSRSQADIATARTRTVVGVKKVVKLFEYIN